MVTFSQPFFLILAIILVPGFLLAARFLVWFQNQTLDSFGQRQTLTRFSRFTSKTLSVILFSLSLAALSLAAAQPTISSNQNVTSPTLNALIVLDASRSMFAEDGYSGLSRFEAATQAIDKLFQTYPNGRFGLILFTNETTIYSPTLDHQSLQIIFQDIQDNYPGAAHGEGSAPLAALKAAIGQIQDLPYSVRTIFLITDGGTPQTSLVSQPDRSQVVQMLNELNLQLIIIGVGQLIPTTIPVYSDTGELVGYHLYKGQVAYTALNEIYLKQLSTTTSGYYIKLNSPTDLVEVASSRNLDSQPTVQQTENNLVWLPVTISIFLVCLLFLINLLSLRHSRIH